MTLARPHLVVNLGLHVSKAPKNLLGLRSMTWAFGKEEYLIGEQAADLAAEAIRRFYAEAVEPAIAADKKA